MRACLFAYVCFVLAVARRLLRQSMAVLAGFLTIRACVAVGAGVAGWRDLSYLVATRCSCRLPITHRLCCQFVSRASLK